MDGFGVCLYVKLKNQPLTYDQELYKINIT